MSGLSRKWDFELLCKEDLGPDAKVLGGRFVLKIKNTETQKPVYKARFVAQRHTDAEKDMLVQNSSIFGRTRLGC